MKSLSVNYYFYILERLEIMGLNRQNVSGIVPLDLSAQRAPGNRIDIEALHKLLKFAQAALSVPHIGLEISKSFRISNFGYAGSIFSTCSTISEAIHYTEKYGCLAHTLGQFRLDPSSNSTNKWVRYIWTPSFTPKEDEKFRQITELVLSNYALTINWLSWSFEGRVEKLTFRHKPKPPLNDYRHILACETEFDAEHNALLIDRDYLEAPIPTANPLKFSLLQQKLNQVLAEYHNESDLLGRVKYAIKKVILRERPTFARVAAELSLTERSLKRYLSKKDARFKDVLQDVKMELCSIYMKQNVSYAEISQLLWYSDQSAFTRAYKNWYNVSPSKHAL